MENANARTAAAVVDTISITWHDSPEAIHRAMWESIANANGTTYDELIESVCVGLTEDGKEVEFSTQQEIDGMRTQGCWAFVDTNTNVIHAWAAPDADDGLVLHMLAHEIGHITGASCDDDIQEELRAEQFGAAAATAFRMLQQRRQPDERIRQLKSTVSALSKIIHDMTTAQQAAWIEWRHGQGAEAAMAWIQNGLIGPGLIPDEEEPYGKEAQSWFDANNSNPLPKCFCGKPSNIAWMGQGFCSDAHYTEARSAHESEKS